MHEYEWMQGERRFFTNKSKTQINYKSLHCVLQDHQAPDNVKMVQFLQDAFVHGSDKQDTPFDLHGTH
jgi:hypothetical protein